MLKAITLTFALALGALTATAQIEAYGTMGAVSNPERFENAQLTYGGGAGYRIGRILAGAELWKSNVYKDNHPIIATDQTLQVILGTVAYRVVGGLHAEAGFGRQRMDYTASGFVTGTHRIESPVTTFGGFYQFGNRIFARTGYRYYVVHGEPNSQQVYTSIGVSW